LREQPMQFESTKRRAIAQRIVTTTIGFLVHDHDV
jgi:hypothetical protein